MKDCTEIKNVVNQLGITTNLRGYHFLVRSVELAIEELKNNELPPKITIVYEKIAKVYNDSWRNVERCLRYARDQAENHNTPLFRELFGCFNGFSVSCMVYVIADYIISSKK